MSWRGRIALLIAWALILGLAAASTTARADSHARIVRLSYVEGDVQVDRRDGHGFGSAFLNMPVADGERLWTRADGRSEVEFEDGSTIRLVPDTRVDFTQLGLRDSGAKVTALDMQEGTAYFDLRRHGDDEFQITLGRQTVHLPQSSQFRLQADSSQVILAVFHGALDVSGPNQSLKIKKNETLTLDLADNQRYFLAKGTNPDRYDDWDKQRQDYRESYAANASVGNVSPYGYGTADLNYYGSYFNVPGYGLMWRPYYANSFWNPYMDGAWVFYPGIGYTWVSAYPWGWIPYRYGAWNFLPGYGWCWRPGGWNNWNTVVVVNNPPSTFQPPRPPAANNGSPVVAVGHGPTTGGGGGRGPSPRRLAVSSDGSSSAPVRGAALGSGASGVNSSAPARNGVVAPPATGGSSMGGASIHSSPAGRTGGDPSRHRDRSQDNDSPRSVTPHSSGAFSSPVVAPHYAAPAPTMSMPHASMGGMGHASATHSSSHR